VSFLGQKIRWLLLDPFWIPPSVGYFGVEIFSGSAEETPPSIEEFMPLGNEALSVEHRK
jgi:hypothetical protein